MDNDCDGLAWCETPCELAIAEADAPLPGGTWEHIGSLAATDEVFEPGEGIHHFDLFRLEAATLGLYGVSLSSTEFAPRVQVWTEDCSTFQELSGESSVELPSGIRLPGDGFVVIVTSDEAGKQGGYQLQVDVWGA